MAPIVLTNAQVLYDGVDLSGAANRAALRYGAELKDVTTFASAGWRERLGGLRSTAIEVAGFADLGTGLADEALFAGVGSTSKPLTLLPTGGAEGGPGYAVVPGLAQYQTGGLIGDPLSFQLSADSADALIRGTVLLNGTKTATGTTTARQLGAAASGQGVYAALHVLGISGAGASMTATLQSDDAAAFSSPTTRYTFGAKTAIGSEWSGRLAGPITDAYWRLAYTISGTSPSIRVVLVVGIL